MKKIKNGKQTKNKMQAQAAKGELEKKLGKKAALLVIDVQNDYCSPGGATARAGKQMDCIWKSIEKTTTVIEAARALAIPIVFTRMEYDEKKIPQTNFERLRIRGLQRLCAPKSWGADFYTVTPAAVGEKVVVKNFYNAFFRTDLAQWLEENEVKTLLFAGVVTNICPLLTAAEAYYRGFELVALSDCLGAYEDQEFALRYMRQQFGATIADSSEVVAVLKKARELDRNISKRSAKG